MTWDEWYEECKEKNPATDPLKWLETVVTQDVMEDPQAHDAMGRLYGGQRVKMKDFGVPNHSYDWTALVQHLEDRSVHVGLRVIAGQEVYCAVSDASETGEGIADRSGLAICLAAVEWDRKRKAAGVEELLDQ